MGPFLTSIETKRLAGASHNSFHPSRKVFGQPPNLPTRIITTAALRTNFIETLRQAVPALSLRRRNVQVDPRYRPFLDEWDKGFATDAVECPEGYEPEVLLGEIPRDLNGTLFRNGPGKFTIGKSRVSHPYDGDGLVASVAFSDGKAYFRARLVRTPELDAEEAAGTVLFRGTFATQREGGAATNAGDLWVKNVSNTNVIAWAGHLWSLFEAGQPYRLNPWTLETFGLESLDGAIKPGLPFDLGSSSNNAIMGTFIRLAQQRLGGPAGEAAAAALPPSLLSAGGDAMTAHPHVDPTTGNLVTFTYRVRPAPPSAATGGVPLMATDVTFYELDPATGLPAAGGQASHTLPGFAFVHDFAMTENYYVLFQNPVTVDNASYIMGAAPAASCVRWVPGRPTIVHVVPRPSASPEIRAAGSKTFTAPPLFVFHHANAYEKDDDGHKIVIDSIHYDSLPAVGREALASQGVDADAAFTSRLRRVEIDLETHVMSVRKLFDGYLEMPAVAPAAFSQRHRFVYGYHSIFEDPQIAVAKVDTIANTVDLWKPGPYRFALEPRFVPRNRAISEDDGYIIAQLFDSERLESHIVILDAADVAAGPVAVLGLRDALPHGLHSCWTDEYYGPSDEDQEAGQKKELRGNVVKFRKKESTNSRIAGSGETRRSTPRGAI